MILQGQNKESPVLSRRFECLSAETREKKRENEKLTHLVLKGMDNRLYLLGRLTYDTLQYFIEVDRDDYMENFEEIEQIIKNAKEEDLAFFWGHMVDYEYWTHTKHIALIDESKNAPSQYMLNTLEWRLKRDISFYESYIDWDKVNATMDQVDKEKPPSYGWGIHYPSSFYDELGELWTKDFLLLSENEYVARTMVRLQEHILEDHMYEANSMR